MTVANFSNLNENVANSSSSVRIYNGHPDHVRDDLDLIAAFLCNIPFSTSSIACYMLFISQHLYPIVLACVSTGGVHTPALVVIIWDFKGGYASIYIK